MAVRPHKHRAPARRRLQVFAYDPLKGRDRQYCVTVDVPYEPLAPGPCGERLHVVDYDGTFRRYLRPVDLEDPMLLLEDGVAPNELEPCFHQQMVYAVASRVLETFDRALGRPLTLRRRGRALRLFPHGIQGRNAFYDPELHAVVFGYFRADEDGVGDLLPGQPVFTCLSQDIVAHEVTHALTHRLRPYFMEWTNDDVPAFHEGFADIVAIFQHFTVPGVLRAAVAASRGDLRESGAFVSLAEEFGHGTGRGAALRTAIDTPDPRRYRETVEPHDRGAILVAAVFDAFFTVYQRRIADLLRLATGGTGRLPAGDLPTDLVNRLTAEAEDTARAILTMCIRAFDYLPPVDVAFGDYLRALVTADRERRADDPHGLRAALIEGFRRRALYPHGVASLSENAVRLQEVDDLEPLPIGRFAKELIAPLAGEAGDASPRNGGVLQSLARALHGWASSKNQARRLGLDPDDSKGKIAVSGFHPTFRVGGAWSEVSVTFTQKRPVTDLGGLPFRGGATVIASFDGTVKYVVAKPFAGGDGAARREAHAAYVGGVDRRDPALEWIDPAARETRHSLRCSFAALHGGL